MAFGWAFASFEDYVPLALVILLYCLLFDDFQTCFACWLSVIWDVPMCSVPISLHQLCLIMICSAWWPTGVRGVSMDSISASLQRCLGMTLGNDVSFGSWHCHCHQCSYMSHWWPCERVGEPLLDWHERYIINSYLTHKVHCRWLYSPW